MKKLTILKHGGGELANQLWNYASVYAYGLEMNVPVYNPSFFEYHALFRRLSNESLVTKLISVFFLSPRRRSHLINKTARLIYSGIAKCRSAIHRDCVISSENTESKVFYLPPTGPVPGKFGECGSVFLIGWLFRNPLGMKKWRKELLAAFAPVNRIETKIKEIMEPLRERFDKVVGIHIRQADYREFKEGRFFVSQERIREIVSEYAKEKILDANKTAFVITSDGVIDESLYKNLNIFISKENSVTDLFLLSRTDTILGSDSSFGAFASWYGNIPHIVFKTEPIDWAYYADKSANFENKYCLLARY